MKRSSLIAFHRVLISAGIAFCFGFAVWTWLAGALTLSLVFLGFALALAFYLWHLMQILGYRRDDPEEL